MPFLALALAFVTSAASDWLACVWSRARERRAYATGAVVAAIIEFVQWTPVLLALEAYASTPHVIIACAVGASAGSVVGFGRERRSTRRT